MTTAKEIQKEHKVIKLSDVQPDPDNPRKVFDKEYIARLARSIDAEGLNHPIVVEELEAGGYQINDGECRYRALTEELGIEEIECIVIPELTAAERLQRQFHLQENHRSWTPIEKALAVGRFMDITGADPSSIARKLGIPKTSVLEYTSFLNLTAREEFVKHKLIMRDAKYINALVRKAAEIYATELEEDFLPEDKEKLELRTIHGIANGEIENSHYITRLKDTFTADPSKIKEYMNSSRVNVALMYKKSGAEGAAIARKVAQMAPLMAAHMRRAREVGVTDEVKAYRDGASSIERLKSELANW